MSAATCGSFANRSVRPAYRCAHAGYNSSYLQIGKALALQLCDRRDAGRHELQERILARLGRIDVQPLVCDLAEIRLDAVFRQADEALVDLRIDLVLLPWRAGEILEEELEAGGVRHHHELELETVELVGRVVVEHVLQHLREALRI